jgi:DNA-binding transcriptional regulator YhcF (GntR family)
MSNVERLLTKPERDRAAKAQTALDAVRDAIDAHNDLPASVTFPMLRELQKRAAPRQGKPTRTPFVMITPETITRTAGAIRDLPGKDRPHTVALAFMNCVGALDWDNGHILLSRDELAERVGVDVAHVGKAMNVLVRMGVVLKTYESVPGMRGRGRVVYSINPHVAWKGDGREEAKAAHTRPHLVHDADADTTRQR